MQRRQQVTLCLCEILLVVNSGKSVPEKIMLNNKDWSNHDGYDHLRRRNERSFYKIADVVLARLKEAQEIVLTGAKELTSKSNYNYKIFTKSGGSKQAEKDFEEFRLPNARYFALTRKNEGKWGEVGDKIIVLESFPDVGRAALVIKPKYRPKEGELTYRILYRDGFYRPKGKYNAE